MRVLQHGLHGLALSTHASSLSSHCTCLHVCCTFDTLSWWLWVPVRLHALAHDIACSFFFHTLNGTARGMLRTPAPPLFGTATDIRGHMEAAAGNAGGAGYCLGHIWPNPRSGRARWAAPGASPFHGNQPLCNQRALHRGASRVCAHTLSTPTSVHAIHTSFSCSLCFLWRFLVTCACTLRVAPLRLCPRCRRRGPVPRRSPPPPHCTPQACLCTPWHRQTRGPTAPT